MNFTKYRVQLSTEKKYSSKYEYKYEYEYYIPGSASVLEEAKVYSRTVLEQTIRTFLELFWNHSKNVLE